MQENTFITCKDLSIGYPERASATTLVKSGLTLKALKGEMVALIGGNGVGKSTLLKTIAGFQPPLSGEVHIHQRPSTEYGPAELATELSFVSTEMVRVANLTVGELVGLGRYPYTNWFGQLGERDKAIVEKAIWQVGLSGYEERRVSRISDGERQRAMIARALAQDTPIMVLDEPTAFLDISNKYEIVSILHSLAVEQGKCILFSTHDLNTALAIADRIWLMLEDKVVEGIPEEMIFHGYFESLFPNNSHLFFDRSKGYFRIRNDIKGKVNLFATGSELQLAAKAMERLGFEVIIQSSVPSCEENFQVFPSSDLPTSHLTGSHNDQSMELDVVQVMNGWRVSVGGIRKEPDSLEELCRVVKQLILPQES